MTASPLRKELEQIIRSEGPIPIDRYMALCLGHPEHGYYMASDRFGVRGDFITAPEVSQLFGEMIGIWCAACFESMGCPSTFNLIELGPGRGTLMADLLRAAKVVSGFLEAASIRLVETSPFMQRLQGAVLCDHAARISWHTNIDEIAEGPVILVANEFFDAMPVRQFQRTSNGWGERAVGLRADKLTLGLLSSAPKLPHWARSANIGEVVEISPAALRIGDAIGRRLSNDTGAALVVDYGYLQSQAGDTLQAIRAHTAVDILDLPGLTDLTAHVNFESLARAITNAGARVHEPLTQRDFLIGMGLELRAEVLSREADEVQKREFRDAVERLAAPQQMGHLFKVLAATSPELPVPHPFHGRFP